MDGLEQVGTAQPQGAVVTETPAAPEAPVSIADHAKQFSKEAQAEQAETGDDLKPIRPVDQQKRSQDGTFAEGSRRMQKKEALKRINDLTGRAKTAEERFAGAEERLARAEAELAQLRRQGGSPQQVAKAEQKVERADTAAQPRRVPPPPSDPEPNESDPKFGNDYGRFLAEHARWSARDEFRQLQVQQRRQAQQRQVQQSYHQTLKTWNDRVEAAKGRYQDFESVAFNRPTRIPEGSPVDVWITEHKAGADVLYYLQSNPQEQDEILRLSVVDQIDRLSLLSQRFSSSPSGQAVATGAAPGRQSIVMPPKPPTPVRTEAQRASETPPPMDGSLSIAEHARTFGKRR